MRKSQRKFDTAQRTDVDSSEEVIDPIEALNRHIDDQFGEAFFTQMSEMGYKE